jgi:hypothetical protein
MASEVFQAVLDESGYKAANPKYPDDVFVFAGYIGKVADWANFTHAWQPIIESHPELEDTNFVKKLMRWEGRKSDDRAIALMKAVTDNDKLGSIRWMLPYQEFRKVIDIHQKGGDENIYFFAWSAVLFQVVGTILQQPNATLDLIYDRNIHEEPKVQAAYETYRKVIEKASPRLAERLPLRPQPMSDTDFWPLRAADGLAWNVHRHYIQRKFSNPLWKLMDSGPKALEDTWTAQDVRDVLSTTQQQREFLNRKSRFFEQFKREP